MSTDLENRLHTTFVRRVDAVLPPAADIDGLIRRARKRRGLRTGAAAVATAAAVSTAVVVASTLTGSPAGDRPGDHGGGIPVVAGGAKGPDPVPGPRQVFVTKDQTYLDGTTLPVKLPWSTGAHIGRLGVAFPEPKTHRPMLLGTDGKVSALAPATPGFAGAAYDDWVAADSDGPTVAWAEHTKTTSRIVAYDSALHRELGQIELACTTVKPPKGKRQDPNPPPAFCPRPYVVGDGIVFIDNGRQAIAWHPMSGKRTDLGSHLPSQAHSKVLTTFGNGALDLGAIGVGWEQARAKGIEGLLSYDGSWLLDANGDPTAINWRHPGQSISYRPPGKVAAAEFDTDGSVLVVTVTGDPNASGAARKRVRWTGWDCALDGPCKQAVAPSTQEIRLVAWDL